MAMAVATTMLLLLLLLLLSARTKLACRTKGTASKSSALYGARHVWV